MAKVILVDNFDRPEIPDQLYKDHLEDIEAEKLAEEYNKRSGDYSSWYAMKVDDDKELYKGLEE